MKKGRTETGSIWLKGDSRVGILFFHGWSSPPDELLPIGRKFNTLGYSFYAPLLKGHGTQSEDLRGVSWKDWEKDAREAFERIKKHAPKVFVCGISMGGNLALLLAEEKNISGIVLLGTPAKFRFHNLGKMSLHILGLAKKSRKKYYPPSVREKMKDRNVYLSYPIDNAKEVARLTDYTRKNLSKINKPLLIIQSKSDHMVTKKSPEMIYKKVKSQIKEIFWLEDAYHVFVNDERVFEKMREFIKKILNSKS